MRLFLAALLIAAPVFAETDVDGGTLNPDEMSLNKSLKRALEGDVDMTICAQGYLMTKKGSHDMARKLFKECADQGWTGTMTWMSYMEENGHGGENVIDAERAAEWDRMAAEAGDPIGKFNYGVDLMRGWGVDRDEAAGRALVDEAARDGVAVAKRLQAAGYDLDEITPDADEWKFKPGY